MARDGERDGGRGRRRWMQIGVLALIVGVVGALVLWLLAGKRYDDAVSGLAPAPVGCDTTLQFESTGTYTLFVETVGEVGDLDGDCDRDDRRYEIDGDELPRVQLTLVDPGGEEVDLDRADGPTYDRTGSAGSAIRTVEIDDTGEYVLTVESDEQDVVVRVGRDPERGVGALRVGAGALLVAGVAIGVTGLLRGRDRGRPSVVAPGAEHWPALPARPPIAPPVAARPTPPYGARPPPAGSVGGRPLPPPPPPPPSPPSGHPLRPPDPR